MKSLRFNRKKRSAGRRTVGRIAGCHWAQDALYRDNGPKLKDGKIVEEKGLDDGVAALTQLGLIETV